MAGIPENTVTVKDLYTWYELKDKVAKLQAAERLMRERVWKHFFTSPKEGTNKLDLGTVDPASVGYDLKLDYPIDRKVDEQTLAALKNTKVKDILDQLKALGFPVDTFNPEDTVFTALKVSVDKLVRYKPELNTKEWRTLTAEQHSIFDRCLEIKPGSAQLKIELNAVGKAAQEAAQAPKAPSYEPGVEVPVFVKVDPNKPPF